jgi:hypothetical protein
MFKIKRETSFAKTGKKQDSPQLYYRQLQEDIDRGSNNWNRQKQIGYEAQGKMEMERRADIPTAAYQKPSIKPKANKSKGNETKSKKVSSQPVAVEST